ncbi:MAG: nitrile hydratase subunit alpha [SAR324 cluster bacterium]|nr:nitrile hydratase subunit alpha [SAR324 cluster bacterium]
MEIRVWDSTSEIRYFVLPEAPISFHKKTLQQLESMVTRNSMIGVEKITDADKPL